MVERWFLAHPHSVGESYFAHLRAAAGFSGLLFLAAIACLVHALMPSLFERSASTIVMRLNDRMRRRSSTEQSAREGRTFAPFLDA
ncbi:MAG TPA: DUF6356 family protein [Micropepsaceae bacterium]|nr:DUF6356 family protein [Micropepsaceae bacterium]